MVGRKRILVATLCVLFFACKKDTNIDTPSAQILAPAGLQTFNVFDTLQVQGHVSDAQGLKSVSIYLANAQSVQVLPAVPVAITSNSMTFTYPYILSDIHLASGEYYITVSASNGTNAGVAFQKIYVDAAPTKRVAVYAVTRNGSGVQTWKFDSAFHSSPGVSLSGNYSAADISSYYQQLYVAAYDSGSVNAISVPNGGVAWSIPGGFSPTPFFTNVYSYNNAAYVSFYSGVIKYFDHNGIVQMVTTTFSPYYPIKTFVWGKYLFAEEKDISSTKEILVLYYAQSGTGYEQDTLPGPVVAIYGMDNDHVFIFGNRPSGAPYMEDFSISGDIYFTPISLPPAKLLSVAQINSGSFFMGFANGIVYQYTYNPSNFVSYIPTISANCMRYDAVNNQLVIASGKLVTEYNCGIISGTQVYSVPLADNILDVEILYNK